MAVAGTALRVIVLWTVGIRSASGVNVPCAAGTRVYSLSVWSGNWLDGLIMRCTGDSEEQAIPSGFNDDPGGTEEEDICAGTAGVQSIEWGVPDIYYGIVYLNITCLDNETYHFSDGLPYDYWNTTNRKTVSCEDGGYVQGITYSADYPEESNFPYFLTDIGFMCSSSTLDPICTDSSGDTALLSEADQPEYCELPSCSETEGCEYNRNRRDGIHHDDRHNRRRFDRGRRDDYFRSRVNMEQGQRGKRRHPGGWKCFMLTTGGPHRSCVYTACPS